MSQNPWVAFLQDEGQAVFLMNGLRMLAMVSPEAIENGIKIIDHETALGPLMDPSAYRGGERFQNARDYTETLRLLQPLIKHLKEVKQR